MIPKLSVTVSIWCFLEKKGPRIGMTFVFGGCGEKLYQVTLSHSRVGRELV